MLSARLSQDASSVKTPLRVSAPEVPQSILFAPVQICCDAQEINRPAILSGPPLDFACLVVVFGNDRGETTVCWDHDVSCVGLQRSGGHVLDGISVAGCNDEVVVPLVRVGLFRAASDGHSKPHSSSVRVTRYFFPSSRVPLVVPSSWCAQE